MLCGYRGGLEEIVDVVGTGNGVEVAVDDVVEAADGIN